MRSFLLVELDRSAIRNQIALLRTDDMLSLYRGADRELAGISFTARAAEADYTYRSVCFPVDITSGFPPCRWYGHTKRLVYRRAGAYFSAADGESGVAAYKADLHPAQAAGRQRGTAFPRRCMRGMNMRSLRNRCASWLRNGKCAAYGRRYRATAREQFSAPAAAGYFDAAEAAEKMREFDIGFFRFDVPSCAAGGRKRRKPRCDAAGRGSFHPLTFCMRSRNFPGRVWRPLSHREGRMRCARRRWRSGSRSRIRSTRKRCLYRLRQLGGGGVLGISKSYYAAAEQLSARLSDGACLTSPDRGSIIPSSGSFSSSTVRKRASRRWRRRSWARYALKTSARGVSQQNMRRLVLMLAQTIRASSMSSTRSPHAMPLSLTLSAAHRRMTACGGLYR